MRQHLDLSKGQAPVPRKLQTPAELNRLLSLAKQGDAAAKDDLYWRMRPLVYRLSVKYGHGSGSAEGHGRYSEAQRQELQQECWTGLAEAIERWDPEHPSGLRFWTVASYRITIAIKEWQGRNSGSISMSRYLWESAWRVQQRLDAAGIVEWEEYSDAELGDITGVLRAGDILRARRGKQGHVSDADLRTSYQSAETDYLDAHEVDVDGELAAWVLALDAIPAEHWEAATYWKLEQLGLAGEHEAQDIIDARHGGQI